MTWEHLKGTKKHTRNGRVSNDPVKDLIKEKFKLPRSLQLYKEFLGKTQVETYKEEDEVIRRLVKGDTKISIIEYLQQRHPEGRFDYIDLDKFIERSDEIHEILKKDTTSLARRWLKTSADLADELADVAFYTKSMIPELRAQGDSSNAIKAINTLNTLLMNVATVQGLLAPQTQVNTQVVVNPTGVESVKQRMREKAHQADFIIKPNDEIPTKQNIPSKQE